MFNPFRSSEEGPSHRPSAIVRYNIRKEGLINAIQRQDIVDLASILSEGELPAELGYNMVREACRENWFNGVRMLVEYGCPVVKPRNTAVMPYAPPMYYAVKNQNQPLINYLIENGCAPIGEWEFPIESTWCLTKVTLMVYLLLIMFFGYPCCSYIKLKEWSMW